jgi:hypothetical protein
MVTETVYHKNHLILESDKDVLKYTLLFSIQISYLCRLKEYYLNNSTKRCRS